MKGTLNNVLIFTVGAAIGSAVTWYFLKNKHEQEIASVIEEFTNQQYRGPQNSDEAMAVEQQDIPAEEKPTTTESGADVKTVYTGMVQKLGYHNYSDVEPVHSESEVPTTNGPRIILPEELGELGYQVIELSYWADGVLTDAKNKRIKDVDALIGKGNLERFGEHEPDALHVRDDEKKLDFEILRDLKRYSDFFGDGPHQSEEE